jgi:hypothetical protein
MTIGIVANAIVAALGARPVAATETARSAIADAYKGLKTLFNSFKKR